jgi:hypothetical protein
MSFDGTEGKFINVETAGAMTKKYREGAHSGNGHTIAHFLGKEKLRQLLDQNGSMGLRIYYAKDTNGEPQIVVVAADQDENDMLDLVLDMSLLCPNRCSKPNALNS